MWVFGQKGGQQVQEKGPKVNPFEINFRHNSLLISDLDRFILNLSHIGPLAMAAEAPDPHHGGPGRMGDG